MNYNIAIDVMSGDHGPAVTIPAAIDVLKSQSTVCLTLVGNEDEIRSYISQCNASIQKRISIVHSTQIVAMDEKPSAALRGKKDSSMRVAINLVKEKKG